MFIVKATRFDKWGTITNLVSYLGPKGFGAKRLATKFESRDEAVEALGPITWDRVSKYDIEIEEIND